MSNKPELPEKLKANQDDTWDLIHHINALIDHAKWMEEYHHDHIKKHIREEKKPVPQPCFTCVHENKSTCHANGSIEHPYSCYDPKPQEPEKEVPGVEQNYTQTFKPDFPSIPHLVALTEGLIELEQNHNDMVDAIKRAVDYLVGPDMLRIDEAIATLSPFCGKKL